MNRSGWAGEPSFPQPDGEVCDGRSGNVAAMESGQ